MLICNHWDPVTFIWGWFHTWNYTAIIHKWVMKISKISFIYSRGQCFKFIYQKHLQEWYLIQLFNPLNLCMRSKINYRLNNLHIHSSKSSSKATKFSKLIIRKRKDCVYGIWQYKVQSCNTVKYNMMLHISMQWLRQNINQGFNSYKTPLTSPWRASYGVSFVKILEEIVLVIMAPDCI